MARTSLVVTFTGPDDHRSLSAHRTLLLVRRLGYSHAWRLSTVRRLPVGRSRPSVESRRGGDLICQSPLDAWRSLPLS